MLAPNELALSGAARRPLVCNHTLHRPTPRVDLPTCRERNM